MTENRFTAPEGFAFGYFTNARGARIRWGHVVPSAPRGTIIRLCGFREPIEKYFETMHEELAQGFAVFALDWRGQGGSQRYLADAMKAHSEGYDEQVETLQQFMQQVVLKQGAAPFIASAHSMGGHILLRHLAAHPGAFDSAVITAVMADIVTPLPGWLARAAATVLCLLGRAGAYAPGARAWAAEQDVFATNDKTSDAVRFHVQTAAYMADAALQVGGPTCGWLRETYRSIHILNDAALLKSITTPILLAMAGAERIVDNRALRRAASLLPQCERVDIAGAKHEIWMERDELRAPWRKRANEFMAAFLQARLKGHI